jgi:hypothetical protein
MDKNTQFALLVIGIPLLGLMYFGVMVLFMVFCPLAEDHPLIAGVGFQLIPLTIGATIWISASAKAYRSKL